MTRTVHAERPDPFLRRLRTLRNALGNLLRRLRFDVQPWRRVPRQDLEAMRRDWFELGVMLDWLEEHSAE